MIDLTEIQRRLRRVGRCGEILFGGYCTRPTHADDKHWAGLPTTIAILLSDDDPEGKP